MMHNCLKLGKCLNWKRNKWRQMSQNHDLFSKRRNAIVRLAVDEILNL